MISHWLKYHVYKFSNKKHGKVEAFLFRCAIYPFLFLFRIPESVSRQIKQEINADNYKLVIRRIAWFAPFSLFSISLLRDEYLDFSLGLNHDASLEMLGFIEKHYPSKIDEFSYRIYSCQFLSQALESQVKCGQTLRLPELKTPELYESYIEHLAIAKAIVNEKNKSNEISDQSLDATTPAVDSKASITGTGKNLLKKDAFDSLKTVLDKFGINSRLFIISGTFLGCIRERDFIKHDYDIDLGIMEDDISTGFLDAINNLEGFRAPVLDFPCFKEYDHQTEELCFKKCSKPSLIKLFSSSGLQIDIFTHYLEDQTIWHGSSLHRWDNSYFELVEYDFLGLSVLGPKDYEQYLTENYGDWRTPVKEFNCSTGTPNTAIANTSKNECYFLKRQYYGA